MTKLILMFNHQLTSKQQQDAQTKLHVDAFVRLPEELSLLWSNIPSDASSLTLYLEPMKKYLNDTTECGDFLLVQGDFGATYQMVNYAKILGVIPVYATTRRKVVEVEEDGKIIKKSIFDHERFRIYED